MPICQKLTHFFASIVIEYTDKVSVLDLINDKLRVLDLSYLKNQHHVKSLVLRDLHVTSAIDAVDPRSLSRRGVHRVCGLHGLERFANHLQVFFRDELYIFDLNEEVPTPIQ